MQRILGQTALVGAVMALASLSFQKGAGLPLSVGTGTIIAMINFWFLNRVVRGILGGDAAPRGWLVFQGFAKLFFLGVVLWWLCTQTAIQPVALLVGLSSILFPLVWGGVARHA